MKKATKILITAAAVAAVAGVSAVSFAAWSAGDAKTQAVGGSTGSVSTVGSITVTPKTGTGTLAAMNALYPVDQGKSGTNSTLPSGGLISWEFTVTTTGEGSQVIKLAGGLTEGTATGKTPLGAAKLYWTDTEPTNSTTASDGTLIGTEAATITPNTDKKVWVYMVAGDTDAMKATINLTFSAEAAAN